MFAKNVAKYILISPSLELGKESESTSGDSKQSQPEGKQRQEMQKDLFLIYCLILQNKWSMKAFQPLYFSITRTKSVFFFLPKANLSWVFNDLQVK